MPKYVHQYKDWPHFEWDNDLLLQTLGEVRNLQGKLVGKMESLGFNLRDNAFLTTLSTDVLKSSEIEGEFLDPAQVRSSVARHLGMELPEMVLSDRNVDGMVEVLLDATQNNSEELTKERLCGWHAALFPTGRSGMFKITTGDYRKDNNGPMQVVSGALGKERVHFEAPHAKRLEDEMGHFLKWFNGKQNLDPVLKAASAHFWFITLHPFDDGNGRLARALTDMLLARADGINQRFYSMSAQLRNERNAYYSMLEQTQRGDLDVSFWMVWFLECLRRTLHSTQETVAKVTEKARFWQLHQSVVLNERQLKMLNVMLDDFFGKLTVTKWAKMQKCSNDTALRDVNDLITKGLLQKDEAGGRSASYSLKF